MTLYLSNFSSRRTPGAHGPGRVWTIMANPRQWERGIGRVAAVAPLGDALRPLLAAALAERRAGTSGPAAAAYRSAFDARLDIPDLLPGHLRGYTWEAMRDGEPVADGDTLCCACSVAHARAGECHRAWAAPHLARAGWSVVLDGRPFNLETT